MKLEEEEQRKAECLEKQMINVARDTDLFLEIYF